MLNMKKTLSFSLISLFFCFALSLDIGANELTYIYEAVLLEDYEKVGILSQQALSKEISEKEKQEAEYFYALSKLYQGEHQAALEIFKDLRERAKDIDLHDRTFLGIINAYYLQGQYREALRNCHGFTRTRADSDYMSTIYLRIARISLRLSHWDPARRYLQTILRKYPDSLEVFSARQLLEEKKFFTVQVGAFLNRQYADALASDLRNQGQYSYIVETRDQDGRTFYRVRVGQISSLNAAKHLKEKLSGVGLPAIVFP